MRVLLIIALLGWANAAVAFGSGEAKRAVSDDRMLEDFGIPLAGAQRAYCSAAIVETQDDEYLEDPPDFVPAVCVITPTKFYVLSVDGGQFVEELQMKIAQIDGAALEEVYLRGRVQVIDGRRVVLLNVWGIMNKSAGNARALYDALVGVGVPKRAPIHRFALSAGWWE